MPADMLGWLADSFLAGVPAFAFTFTAHACAHAAINQPYRVLPRWFGKEWQHLPRAASGVLRWLDHGA
ncbi:hypothetical protein, partial [Verminephrobacter eiseniae]|uniref:hypothetical protein n=1 Tax=Verminephrobacter eiseniae TaxID=364317 RepID=UPI002243CC52